MRRLPSLAALLALVATLAVVVTLTSLPATGPAAAQPSTAASTAGGTASGTGEPARPPATRAVVVRPVTSEGRPAPGWTTSRLSGSVTCDGAAPGAVDPRIAGCYPTAYGLQACWRSTGHTVLCVRDARGRQLFRVRHEGRFPRGLQAPTEPTPVTLALDGGRRCLSRVGGAWGAPPQHPDWIGYYSCTQGASVYGPPDLADGIDRTGDAWRVRLLLEEQGTLVRRHVRTVWYVGTAAA
ncbi:hypothetical protein [Nocardioides dongxiaopingii]|uniref:hypothetical protein n=1 Tax=Nocardioides dongxiaopingii TaxID=2576036 RepID=UPI0010C76633|nr:hypothetical protein [Nocardioides dongxiaopingii]